MEISRCIVRRQIKIIIKNIINAIIHNCAVNNMCNCRGWPGVMYLLVNLRELYLYLSPALLYVYLGSAFLQRDSLRCKLYQRALPALETCRFPALLVVEWVHLILGYSITKPTVATELNLILQTACSFWPLSLGFLSLFLN